MRTARRRVSQTGLKLARGAWAGDRPRDRMSGDVPEPEVPVAPVAGTSVRQGIPAKVERMAAVV
ncbi:hypothetical protein [Azospirillum sp. sgz301742]